VKKSILATIFMSAIHSSLTPPWAGMRGIFAARAPCGSIRIIRTTPFKGYIIVSFIVSIICTRMGGQWGAVLEDGKKVRIIQRRGVIHILRLPRREHALQQRLMGALFNVDLGAGHIVTVHLPMRFPRAPPLEFHSMRHTSHGLICITVYCILRDIYRVVVGVFT